MLWAVMVPLWIPLDLLLIGGPTGRKLAAGRIIVALFLGGGVYACRCRPTQGNVWRAYSLLFGTPLLFFVAFAPFFHLAPQWRSVVGQTYLSTYRLLPLLVAASVGLMPVTVVEAAMIVSASLVASIAGAAVAAPQSLLVPAELGWLWVLLVAGGVGTLSGLSQTALLLHSFCDAVTDPLTGLLNRRAGVSQLTLQWAQALRNKQPLSVVLIDLDEFKSVNDRYGHEAGDETLAKFVEHLRIAFRAGDALVRWGGEEFLVVLPESPKEAAKQRVERLLFGQGPQRPSGNPLTFSAGVAELTADATDSVRELVALADRRMYMAKRGGRASVVAEGGVTRSAA